MVAKVITPRDADAVAPLATLRLQARIDGTGDDMLLGIWRNAAFQYAEHRTQRSLGPQVREFALDAFPCGPIRLEQGPVTAITYIKYMDTDGVLQTLDQAAYTLDDFSDPQWAVPAYGTTWPATRACVNAVRVCYAAGTDPLDPAAYAAILLLVSHADKNREAVASGNFVQVPLGVDALLDTLVDYS